MHTSDNKSTHPAIKAPYGVIFFLLLGLLAQTEAQTPLRKAWLGVLSHPVDAGIQVDSVVNESTFAALSLQKGDIIESINGRQTSTQEAYYEVAGQLRTGDAVKVAYTRNGKAAESSGTAVMRPFESAPDAYVLYDWVKFRNGYLRTMTWRPKTGDHLPCILLIPGYGCGSIENYSASYNGKLIAEWVKNGYAVVAIEKSGVGDSDGCAPCNEVDLRTDIESFDAGYEFMEKLPFADKDRLFIWGHSMGGTIAPEVARRHSPRGVMVFACVFRPWSEFLLEMHRVQKPLMENLTYRQTEDFVRGIQKIYYEFFRLKKTPAQLHEIPEYRPLVESEMGYAEGNDQMWGRHWRFWQQLDSVNLAQSWQEVNCPVLVLHGGADYEQCSLVEPLMIQKTVNEAHPGMATWVTIPDLDHFMMKSADWQEAYAHFRDRQYLKGNFNGRIAEATLSWLSEFL
ncbi:MAG: alpha/beta fold hydrolase [Lewinella sp.]|nr:alpha/beta fold hydrolase [Lewinella sp.]